MALAVLLAAGVVWAGDAGAPAKPEKKKGFMRRVLGPLGGGGGSPAAAPAAAAPAQHAAAPSAGDEYVIGPEDQLGIHVWQEPQLSRSVAVRPDGKISMPLLGELTAGGMTPEKLKVVIAAGLKAYLANPEVAVIVEKVNSRKFNVLGEVMRPGSFDLAKPVTVLDALALAGGFREFAKTKDIYVLRRMTDGSASRLPFNYKDVLKGKNSEQNVPLQAGDTIIVP